MCSKTITLTLSLEFQRRQRSPGTGAVWDSLNYAACINSSPLSLHLHPSLLIANLPLKLHLSLLGLEGFTFISALPALHFLKMLRMHKQKCSFVITEKWWCCVMFGRIDSRLRWHKCIVWITAWSQCECCFFLFYFLQNIVFDRLFPFQRKSSGVNCVFVANRCHRASVNDSRLFFCKTLELEFSKLCFSVHLSCKNVGKYFFFFMIYRTKIFAKNFSIKTL